MVEFVKGPSKLLSYSYEPRWPNTKAVKIGWLAGRGNGSTAIEKILADGTTAESIRTVLQRAELERIGENRNVVYIPVRLTAYERTQLNRRAIDRKMDLAEWMRRIAVAAGIPDDLFNAIVEE